MHANNASKSCSRYTKSAWVEQRLKKGQDLHRSWWLLMIPCTSWVWMDKHTKTPHIWKLKHVETCWIMLKPPTADNQFWLSLNFSVYRSQASFLCSIAPAEFSARNSNDQIGGSANSLTARLLSRPLTSQCACACIGIKWYIYKYIE